MFLKCNIGQLGIICMLLLRCDTVPVEVKCIGTVKGFYLTALHNSDGCMH